MPDLLFIKFVEGFVIKTIFYGSAADVVISILLTIIIGNAPLNNYISNTSHDCIC